MEAKTKYMTVIKENDKSPDTFECIDLNEVDFIETNNRRIIYHIGDKKYHQISTKSELEDFLINDGFESLDRPNIVNLRKMKKFDEDRGVVYFVKEPTKASKYATVAKIKYRLVSAVIKRIKAKNGEPDAEVTKKGGLTKTFKGVFKKND